MKLKAPASIIFDLDDTLIPSSQFYTQAVSSVLRDDPKRLAAYEEARQLVKADLPRQHTSARNRMLYFKRLLELMGDTESSVIDLYNSYEAELSRLIREWTATSDRLSLIRSIQNRYQTYILTNETVRTQLAKITALNLGKAHGFRGIVCSEEVGFEKPDPRIFQCLLDRYHLDPTRCLFVGDSVENDIRPAREFGMNVVQTIEFVADKSPSGTVTVSSLEGLLDILP